MALLVPRRRTRAGPAAPIVGNLSAPFLTVLKNSSFIIARSLFLSHQEESNELFFLRGSRPACGTRALRAAAAFTGLIHELSFRPLVAISAVLRLSFS